MTDELSIGLADLDVQDDLEIGMDNETYQDNVNPPPPVAGNYVVKAVNLQPKKNKQQEPVFEGNDKRFPILRLNVAEIVEGLGDGVTRKVSLFQDIRTKPFDRFGTAVSNLGDITRSYGTDSWTGIPAGLQALQQAVQGGQTFTIQLDWLVDDYEFTKEAQKQLNIPENREERTEEQKKLLNAIYKAAKVQGMRNFPFDADKKRFIHVVQRTNVTFQNPNTGSNVTVEMPHRALEAKAVLTKYYPKADVDAGRVKIGPSNVKPAAPVAAVA